MYRDSFLNQQTNERFIYFHSAEVHVQYQIVLDFVVDFLSIKASTFFVIPAQYHYLPLRWHSFSAR